MRALHLLLATAALVAGGCVLGSPVREGWASVPGGDVHWEERGSGDAIVLLHGGGLDMRQWDDEVAWLSKRWRVLRYDERGSGSSASSTVPYSPSDDLLELLDRTGIDRAVLVGHSNGGRVAIDLALQHPERVAGLFLLAPGLSGWESDRDELSSWLAPIERAVAAGDRERVLELWLASPFLSVARGEPDVERELTRLARDNVGLWFRPDLETAPAPLAATRLSDVEAPTRVLVGTEDLARMQRIAEAIAVHVAGAELVRVEGVDHLIDMEAPEVVRTQLETFLSELDW